MVEIKKYELLEIAIDRPSTIEHFKFWHECVANLIKQVSEESILSILTPDPTKYSIGFDIGTVERRGKFNSIKYLLTLLNKPSLEEIKMITTSDEFYLGLIVLVIGEVDEHVIQNLLLLWHKDPIKSEVEFLKMDSDGLCFYWYNPESLDKANLYFNTLRSSLYSQINLKE